MALKTLEERRKVSRVEFQSRVELDLPQRSARLEASSLNLSEGGICLRVQEAMEIRVPVMLRLFAQPHSRPLECPGRVAWVVQRLDLRDVPPFLYDVGIEFVNPSSRLRQFASRIGLALKRLPSVGSAERAGAGKRTTLSALQPATIHGRYYEPRLAQEPSPDHHPWHLIVSVEGVPCFSRRYPSEHEALEGWKQFKRQAAKVSVREVQR